jgi:hypothetical protein
MGSDSCDLYSCSSVNQHALCCVIFPMLYLHHVSSESCGVMLSLLIWECHKQQAYECWKGNNVSHTMPGCTLRHWSRVGKSRAEQHSTAQHSTVRAEQHRPKCTHWNSLITSLLLNSFMFLFLAHVLLDLSSVSDFELKALILLYNVSKWRSFWRRYRRNSWIFRLKFIKYLGLNRAVLLHT